MTYRDKIEQEAEARAMCQRAGMIYWPGGDEPPSNWDGGPYLCRDGGLYHMRGYDWRHGTGCYNTTADWDRIGYRAIARREHLPADLEGDK